MIRFFNGLRRCMRGSAGVGDAPRADGVIEVNIDVIALERRLAPPLNITKTFEINSSRSIQLKVFPELDIAGGPRLHVGLYQNGIELDNFSGHITVYSDRRSRDAITAAFENLDSFLTLLRSEAIDTYGILRTFFFNQAALRNAVEQYLLPAPTFRS